MAGEAHGDEVPGSRQAMALVGAAAGGGAALQVALGTYTTRRRLPPHRALIDGRSQEGEVPLRWLKERSWPLTLQIFILRSLCISECFLALFLPHVPCTSQGRMLGWCWFILIACPLQMSLKHTPVCKHGHRLPPTDYWACWCPAGEMLFTARCLQDQPRKVPRLLVASPDPKGCCLWSEIRH